MFGLFVWALRLHRSRRTVLVGFHEENEGRVIEANISAGQSFMFPRGSDLFEVLT